MQRGYALPITIVEQGAVRVNRAVVARNYRSCILATVDLHSKYVDVMGTGSGDDIGPRLYLAATPNTRYVDETQPLDRLTVVEFRDLIGWTVFGTTDAPRYTILVTLLKGWI